MSVEGGGQSGRQPPGSEAVIQELRSVLASSAAGNIQIALRIRDLVVSAASQRPRDRDRSKDVGHILDFIVASVRLLSENSLVVANGILDAAEARLLEKAPPVADEPSDAAPGDVEIILKGARGHRADAAFLLENKYDRSIDVAFEMSDLTSEGGAVIPGAFVSIDPASVTLSPRGQAVIRISIEVGDLLTEGVSYLGMLRASGFETRQIRIRLQVEAQESLRSPTETTGSPAKRRRPRPAAA